MRRLLPLLAPFGVSIALAAAVQAGLPRDAPGAPVPRPMPASPTSLLLLTSGESRLVCLTTSDRVAADQLEVNDIQTMAAAVCR